MDADALRRWLPHLLAPDPVTPTDPEDRSLVAAWLAGDAPADGATAAAVARLHTPIRPYLDVIAEANRLPDPLAPEVVGAHWLGGALLEAVLPRLVHRQVRRDLGDAADLASVEATLTTAVPTHAFHVTITSGWARALHAGQDGALERMDGCRIRSGTVEAIGEGQVQVRSRRWELRDRQLAEGVPTTSAYRLAEGAATSWLSPGDVVALHWDQAVDRLLPEQAKVLAQSTARVLAIVNGTAPAAG